MTRDRNVRIDRLVVGDRSRPGARPRDALQQALVEALAGQLHAAAPAQRGALAPDAVAAEIAAQVAGAIRRRNDTS